MIDEDDFQAALDREPERTDLRALLSDWLRDRGDPRADWYLLAAECDRRPFHVSLGWSWYPIAPNKIPGPLIELSYSDVSIELYDVLSLVAEPKRKHGPTRRGTEDAAVVAFAGLSPEDRERVVAEVREYYERTRPSR